MDGLSASVVSVAGRIEDFRQPFGPPPPHAPCSCFDLALAIVIGPVKDKTAPLAAGTRTHRATVIHPGRCRHRRRRPRLWPRHRLRAGESNHPHIRQHTRAHECPSEQSHNMLCAAFVRALCLFMIFAWRLVAAAGYPAACSVRPRPMLRRQDKPGQRCAVPQSPSWRPPPFFLSAPHRHAHTRHVITAVPPSNRRGWERWEPNPT